MERKYMMYEGEEENTIDLLYETETTERNGVKIIVPVKYIDAYEFESKITTQLCYFENVYFEIYGDTTINTKFTILRHSLFQSSGLCKNNNLHLCLDNVYYPLDFDKLGVPPIKVPLGIRLSLTDGVYPTPNRESIRYTKEAKKIIIDKIGKIATYVIESYNNSLKTTLDLENLVHNLDTGFPTYKIGETLISLNYLANFSSVTIDKPSLPEIKLQFLHDLHRNTKNYILSNHIAKYKFSNNKFLPYGRGYNYNYTYHGVSSNKVQVFEYSDVLSPTKKEYLKTIIDKSKHVFLVKKGDNLKLRVSANFQNDSYYHMLNLKSFPKNTWRERIKEFQFYANLFTSTFIDLDKIEVPQSFIDDLKSKKKTRTAITKKIKMAGDIICKLATSVDNSRYYSKSYKFESKIYKIQDIPKMPRMLIYTTHEKANEIGSLFSFLETEPVDLITLSNRELKIVEKLDFHNLISYEEFINGHTKIFKRAITAYYGKQILQKHYAAFYLIDIIERTCPCLDNLIKITTDFVNKHSSKLNSNYEQKIVLNRFLENAIKENLFDTNVYSEMCQLDSLLNKLSFITTLGITSYNRPSNADIIIKDIFVPLLKRNKIKVNLKYYNVKQQGE